MKRILFVCHGRALVSDGLNFIKIIVLKNGNA